MSSFVLVDSGPLGIASNPKASPEALQCRNWLTSLLAGSTLVVIPEICDYEVRRELLRSKKTEGIRRLDALKSVLLYLPLTTSAMLRAARFWADARNRGRPTAEDADLDCDMILSAQASELALGDDDVVIATTNVRHLDLFAQARHWKDIGSRT